MKTLAAIKEVLFCCCLVSILWSSCEQRKETREFIRDVGLLKSFVADRAPLAPKEEEYNNATRSLIESVERDNDGQD